MNTVKHLAGLVAFVFVISCGGGGGGGSTTETSSSSDPLIGNYTFIETSTTITSLASPPDSCKNGAGVRCYTITTKTNNTTTEGTPIYTGTYATADGSIATPVSMGWYPSLSAYVMAEEDTYGIGVYQWYKFNIGDGGAVTGVGCMHVAGSDTCWQLSGDSIKTAEGEWPQ